MALKSEAGMTLIEVVLAMAVLSIGLLALGMMQIHFAEGTARSRQLVHATDIAVNKIEELANLGEGHDDLQAGSHGSDIDEPNDEPLEGYSLDYFLSWEVEDVAADSDHPAHKAVDIAVKWRTGSQDHEVNFHWRKGI